MREIQILNLNNYSNLLQNLVKRKRCGNATKNSKVIHTCNVYIHVWMSEALMSRKVYIHRKLVELTARYFILGKYQLVGKGVLLLELLIAAYLKKNT